MSSIRTSGEMMRVSIDIPKSDIPEAIGLIALEGCVLDISVRVNGGKPEPKAKKEKGPKGPFSEYWRSMFLANFNASLDLHEVLGVEGINDVRPALHDVFSVDTLADVSPFEFDEWCDRNGLHGMISLSRQCAAKAQGVMV